MSTTSISPQPGVAVIVPIAYLHPETFKQMVDAIVSLDYSNLEVYVVAKLDSSDRPAYEQTCRSAGITLVIQSATAPGYKARALNRVLDLINERDDLVYGIIIDGHHLVRSDMVTTFVSYFEQLPDNVGYVQAGVDYTGDNLVQYFGRTLRAQLYYFYIRARSQFGNAQFNGSTSCFRLTALYTIGGFPEYSYTENSATSIRLRLAGYRGKFLNQSLSRCEARPSLASTVSQLYRWGHGLGAVVNREMSNILRSDNLSIGQKLDIAWYHLASSPASSLAIILPMFISLRVIFASVVPALQSYLYLEYVHLVIIALGLLNFGIVGTFTILAEDSDYGTITRYWHLVIFTLLSLSFPIFIVRSFSQGYNNVKGPDADDSAWAFNIDLWRGKMILVLLIIVEILVLLIAINYKLYLFLPILAIYIAAQVLIIPME